MAQVRTRFAPSPTGYMHIGGMRTALFNWLWSRHNGGVFVLRIDDTDRQRNLDEALAPILRAFRWLDLTWDEGPEVGGPFAPYFQSQRGDLYRAAAEKLLAAGKAYRDYDTPEQIKADREAADKEKRQYVNIRRALELTDSQRAQNESEGRPYVIRFLVPREEKVIIDDAVRGRIEWECALMSDPVILRGDGSPFYNFATVVDDAQMQITDVIRAEEHLSNTPIQVLLHRALGHTLPRFAHIPYVAAPGSKEKLSKRKLDAYRKNPQFKRMFESADRVFPRLGLEDSGALDPVMVEYYERIGYLPHAVVNNLARLGWSLDDKTEVISRQTIIENFSLERVVKSPAGFDPDKLDSLQQHWMRELPAQDKIDGCLPYLVAARFVGENPDAATKAFVGRLIEALGDRLKLFSDVLEYSEFFVADEKLPFDEKTFDKRLRQPPAAAALLAKYRKQLVTIEPFDAPTLEAALKTLVEGEGAKIGDLIHALRVAVTGKAVGAGMFETLALLGRDRCLNRIDRALGRIE